jgi:hypothetical protein
MTAINFLTPKGRLVQGHPMEPQTKNVSGQPLVTKAGQPTQKYFCAVAFPKFVNGQHNPEFAQFYALLVQAAQQGFPQIVGANGQANRKFAWKVTDGDGTDENGRPNSEKEGFAGHWVVKFSTTFPPKCFYAGMYAPHQQIQDKNVIQRGYYVRISGTVEANGDAQKPGLYVNMGMVELTEQGPIIVGGPDAAAVFGAAPVAPYQPTTPTPQAPAMPGGFPGGAAPMAASGQVPQPGMTPAIPSLPAPGMFPAVPGATASPALPAPGAVPPAVPVTPHPGFLGGPAGGTMPTPPAAPAVPAGPQKTAAWPAAFTYEQMIAAGWTDATLRQNGYIV